MAVQLACLSGELHLWCHSKLEPMGGWCTLLMELYSWKMFKMNRGFYRHLMVTKVVYCQHHVVTDNSGYYAPHPADSLRIKYVKILPNFLLWSSLGCSLMQHLCSWEWGDRGWCHPRDSNVFCKRIMKWPAWCSTLPKMESPSKWLVPFTCE